VPIVPLDSTTYVQLTDAERRRVADYASPLTYSLECLYRLWVSGPAQQMTLHDQLAVAETASPCAFLSRREMLPLVVDNEGYTRINRGRGEPATVCLEPKGDESMKYYLDELTNQRLGL
jgi:hypothetical protein